MGLGQAINSQPEYQEVVCGDILLPNLSSPLPTNLPMTARPTARAMPLTGHGLGGRHPDAAVGLADRSTPDRCDGRLPVKFTQGIPKDTGIPFRLELFALVLGLAQDKR